MGLFLRTGFCLVTQSVTAQTDGVFAAVMVDLLELSSVWTQARAQPA